MVPDVTARRLRAQLLAGEPARSPIEVTRRLLAVQGQDPRGARLAIRARSTGLTAGDVDRALTEDRSLLITWLNRGTLHLVQSEDYWLLQSLTVRPHERQAMHVLARSGVTADDADRGIKVIIAALTADGPLTRLQLRDRLVRAGVPTGGNVALHMLVLTCLRGMAVRGPMVGTQHAYVLVRDWLGAPPADWGREAALAELARRYLAGHGPAGDADLAKWAGLPLGQARRGLAAITSELRELPGGLVTLASDDAGPAELPGPRLLGQYDPVLLGWKSRDPILGSHRHIVSTNGLFRPFVLVDGRAAGMWAWTEGRAELKPFGDLPAEVMAALAAEAEDVRRFFGPRQPAQLSSTDGPPQRMRTPASDHWSEYC